jgi:regulator of protease activity HflC (stomatin/prohibitin superfamily)
MMMNELTTDESSQPQTTSVWDWQEPLLCALPYLLLLAFFALAAALDSVQPLRPAVPALWWLLRWGLRLTFLAGALIGWRRGRPRWFYPWLGFAIYELVALPLALTMWLLGRGVADSALSFFALGLPLLALSFASYFIITPLVARRDRLLAAYTVFPHAALTAPLFLVVQRDMLGPMALAGLIPILVAAAASGLFGRLHSSRTRWGLLVAGVLLCQTAFVVSATLAVGEFHPSALFPLPILWLLGLVILFGPMLLLGVARLLAHAARRIGWSPKIMADTPRPGPSPWQTIFQRFRLWLTTTVDTGGQVMTSEQASISPPAKRGPTTLDRLFKAAVVFLAAAILIVAVLGIARAVVYKIQPYERGLHLRGGRFIGVNEPGWHTQIPFWDTVIVVKVNERLGYVERISAMTSDDVTMVVSLEYTYRVTDPQRFALEVDDPERIVFEFVQGKLRDVVNTKPMSDVMHSRAAMNQEVMEALRVKEEPYGVEFITVQMQSAEPPTEVVQAIKDRMVALQRREQAQTEAEQTKTVADAEFYAAQKQADAEAYQISKTAEARRASIEQLLGELKGHGDLAEKYLDYLIAQELKENSKWVIGGEGTPIVDLRGE